jgi:hypothetical protein
MQRTGHEAKCRASEKQMRRNYVVTSPFITRPVGGIPSTAKTVTFLMNLNFMNWFTIDGVQDGASVLCNLNELNHVKEAVLGQVA